MDYFLELLKLKKKKPCKLDDLSKEHLHLLMETEQSMADPLVAPVSGKIQLAPVAHMIEMTR